MAGNGELGLLLGGLVLLALGRGSGGKERPQGAKSGGESSVSGGLQSIDLAQGLVRAPGAMVTGSIRWTAETVDFKGKPLPWNYRLVIVSLARPPAGGLQTFTPTLETSELGRVGPQETRFGFTVPSFPDGTVIDVAARLLAVESDPTGRPVVGAYSPLGEPLQRDGALEIRRPAPTSGPARVLGGIGGIDVAQPWRFQSAAMTRPSIPPLLRGFTQKQKQLRSIPRGIGRRYPKGEESGVY